MKPQMTLLSCSKLVFKDSKDQILLDHVSLEVQAGEKVAIVGPNGAGKSILQKHLSGRLNPAMGEIKLHDKSLSAIPPLKRAQLMAVMAQSEQIEPLLSVAEYVSLGRIPHQHSSKAKEDNKQIDRAIKICGLEKFKDQTIQTLSGGERQRTSLARAIAQSPELLLLDEPTNHLDLRARADILKLVKGLPSTVIAVLHDLSLVHDFADRVIVVRQGKIISDGPPSESLSPAIVRDVFGMETLDVLHPVTGKPLRVYEAPHLETNIQTEKEFTYA
ncbi:ABC transporter ATP-binding protein [Curvivirga aplysinae]|uniref:ABC transporter ATP-binding protein n=1 Tax=Curvivirga aplysinae TaxID=2529852 RepID=UPI0012BBCB16|nr:ABC transporter ATP-binding protein [Curvivirga aplysinae]MTI11371.1 ABC transporter ATP-binding protein [Curvivirga aplysinae]